MNEDVDALVREAARSVYRRYRGYVTFEDMVQHGTTWVLSHPARVGLILADEDSRRSERKLIGTVHRTMTALARREKAFQSGYRPEDEAYYSAEIIATVLPALFDEEYAESGPEREEHEVKSRRDPAIGDNWPIHLADVRHSWKCARLSVRQRGLISMRYGSHLNLSALARAFEISETDVERELTSAMRSLIRCLGGPRMSDPCGRGCEECAA